MSTSPRRVFRQKRHFLIEQKPPSLSTGTPSSAYTKHDHDIQSAAGPAGEIERDHRLQGFDAAEGSKSASPTASSRSES